jgi:hypothetical protein
MTMANDLADLYDSLILKTKEKQLVWVEDPNGAALTARVGDLLIRVSGLILRGERLSSNAFTQAIRAQNAAAAIAVYDKEAKLVARGGRVVNYMNPQSGHQAGTIRNFVRGGAGYHLGGCLNEALTEHDGELRFGC